MLTNYVYPKKVVDYVYSVEFLRPGGQSGFSFPCEKDGTLLPMSDCAEKNYQWCINNASEFETYNYISRRRQVTSTPAHGHCECGREVYLYNQYLGACECECGRWYNLFGQELNPPQYWEEDY